jgi:protein-arginine kinase activator protein McsA
MLCQNCHEREATCHAVAIADGVSRSRDLCNECFEAESPEAKERASEARAAHYQYCGGQLCAGGTDFLVLMTGVQQMKYMCMPCSMEHNDTFSSSCSRKIRDYHSKSSWQRLGR